MILGSLAMALVVLASNILVQVPLGAWLTWGALSYPVAFLVTDVTNRIQGARAARRVVLAGFVAGIACSLVASQIAGPDGPLTTLAIAVGSGAAFLAGQLLDIAVFDRLRRGRWWRAPLVSSLVGSAVDTAIFFTIAFSAPFAAIFGDANAWAREVVPLLGTGPQMPLWISLALADFAVKLALAALALAPFRAILGLRKIGV